MGDTWRTNLTAIPPADLHGHHYGPVLQACILHQYHGCSVTQPELLDWLQDVGISMSSGELSQLLTQGHDQFHAEKEELLATGILCSSYIQTDDTGTRHKGQNGYCTIIDNESFAWSESTGSKSRENFVSLLHRPWPTYSLTEDALAYLEKHDYPQKWLWVLKPSLPLHNNLSESLIRGICEATKDQWWNAKRCRAAMSRYLCQLEENVSPVWSFILGLSDRQANRRRGVPKVGGFD